MYNNDNDMYNSYIKYYNDIYNYCMHYGLDIQTLSKNEIRSIVKAVKSEMKYQEYVEE